MSLLLWLGALPYMLMGRIILWSQYPSVRLDLNLCISVVKGLDAGLCPEIYSALMAGEDHRFEKHVGIDPIAIVRVVWIRLRHRKRQGGSTIEQQLVRVITGRYEVSARRKFREQVLAVALSRVFKKRHLASAYVQVAYFGTGFVGMEGLMKLLEQPGYDSTLCPYAGVVAHLKYPRPSNPSSKWQARITARARHIASRREKYFPGLTTAVSPIIASRP